MEDSIQFLINKIRKENLTGEDIIPYLERFKAEIKELRELGISDY